MDKKDEVGLGRRALDYVNTNATEIAAGVITLGVGAGVVALGGKAAVTTACLVGGGAAALLGVNILAKVGVGIVSAATKQAVEATKHSFAKPDLQQRAA